MLAVVSLAVSVIGLCAKPYPILWLWSQLGDSIGALIMAILIGAAVIFVAIYGIILRFRR